MKREAGAATPRCLAKSGTAPATVIEHPTVNRHCPQGREGDGRGSRLAIRLVSPETGPVWHFMPGVAVGDTRDPRPSNSHGNSPI